MFGTAHREQELSAEIESHIQMHIDDNVHAGLTREEARRQALLKLGGIAQVMEDYRDQHGFHGIESLVQDIRFGLRVLRKNPGFTAVAVLTLALGIGATTAMFTVVDGALLKSLRYPEADRVVSIDTGWRDSTHEISRTSGGDVEDLRGAVGPFAAFSYYDGGAMGVQVNHGADFGGVYQVDPAFFQVFQVRPDFGRTFISEDAGRSAVVSAGFAARNFGSESAALGQTIAIESTAYEVVGVLPPTFQFPSQAAVWAAVSPIPQNLERTAYNYHSVARLKAGVTPEVADASLSALARRLSTAFPDSNRDKFFVVQPLQRLLSAPLRTSLVLLMAGVGLLLLIACTNVANLMLARVSARVRELAVRAAVGAGRWRIRRQLLSEGLLIGFGGCLLGIVLARAGTEGMLAIGARFIPPPLLADVRFDWRVLAFAMAASFLTSILFGTAPAWVAGRIDLQGAIKSGTSGGLSGDGTLPLRSFLVVAQVALSLTLAIASGLFVRTVLALRTSPLGYRTEGILVAYASAPAGTLAEALADNRSLDDLLRRLRKVPGVFSVAAAMGLPAGEYGSNGSFAIEGKQSFSGDMRRLPYAVFSLASPDYFATMGIPLLRGRGFNDGDLYDRPAVAVVSDSLTRQNFPNEDPIGHRIMCGLDSPKWMTIVGVVGDVRQVSPAAQPGADLYMPLQQHPFMATDAEVVMRAVGNPRSLIPDVEKIIRTSDPSIALRFTTMGELVDDSIGAQRFRTAIASSFAALALLVAISGMYAVMSCVTAQRTAEFGVRAALGALPSNIVRMVMWIAARLAATGVLVGVLLSLATGKLLSSVLFGVKTTDPVTYLVVTVLVFAAIVLAAALPAWRASRIDPMAALRYE
jgi:putative ABC transport system permease protein